MKLHALEPGDVMLALRRMRSWEDETRRGRDGLNVEPGEIALVLSSWAIGKQTRIRAVVDGRIMLLSCPRHTVALNWYHLCEL